MQYLRLSPCSLPTPPCHRSVCPKHDPSPPFLLEVPPSSSPCLSHISQPQSPLHYERGSLGLGNQCSSAGSGSSTVREGDQEGLSAHTQLPSPTTSRAVGHTPPVSIEEKHSLFPQCPLPSTSLHRLASLPHQRPGNMQLEEGGRGERRF